MRSEFVLSVLDQIEILELVSENATIENNQARCPFPDHTDNNPSFVVYPGDQSFGVFCPTPRKGIFQKLRVLFRQ
jgi:DNA primase